MNRRITKSLAEDAAENLRRGGYEERLDALRSTIDKAIEALVHKYIPNPVLAVTKEYGNYLCPVNNVGVTAYCAKNYRLTPINGRISTVVPHSCRTIDVDLDDYKMVKNLMDDFKRVYDESYRFKKDVVEALLSLRTEEKIKMALPEAIPFIKFPEKINPPAKVYDDLRKIIGGIKL